MMRPRLLALTLAAAAGFAACGGDNSTLSSQARAGLHDRVAQIRSAAASGDPETARFMLVGLEEQVADLEQAGKIPDDQRARILAAAAEVADALDLVVPTTTTTIPPPDDDEENGNGKGKGNGKD